MTIAVPPDDMARLLAAVAEAGGVDQLLAPRRARTKLQPVAFTKASEVLDALANKVITRSEARKLLAGPTVRTRRS
jgi:hypothetical protein